MGESQIGQSTKCRLDVTVQRDQKEPGRRPGYRFALRCRIVEHDQFDDAGIRRASVAEKDRLQGIGSGVEQGRPVAGEYVVEEDRETQAVPPKGQCTFESVVTIAV